MTSEASNEIYEIVDRMKKVGWRYENRTCTQQDIANELNMSVRQVSLVLQECGYHHGIKYDGTNGRLPSVFIDCGKIDFLLDYDIN